MMEQMPMQPAAMIAALDVDSPPPLSISCGAGGPSQRARVAYGRRWSWQCYCYAQQQQVRTADESRRCRLRMLYQGRRVSEGRQPGVVGGGAAHGIAAARRERQPGRHRRCVEAYIDLCRANGLGEHFLKFEHASGELRQSCPLMACCDTNHHHLGQAPCNILCAL